MAERGAYIGLRLYTILSASCRSGELSFSCTDARTPRVMAYKYTQAPFGFLISTLMCYSSGSIDQALNPCPMCKVYPHVKCVARPRIARLLMHNRCPHIRKTCTNRGAHPRMDVLYLTNAEGLSSSLCVKLPLKIIQSSASTAAASARYVR